MSGGWISKLVLKWVKDTPKRKVVFWIVGGGLAFVSVPVIRYTGIGERMLMWRLRKSIVNYVPPSWRREFPPSSIPLGANELENTIEKKVCAGGNVLLTGNKSTGKSRAYWRILRKCSNREDVIAVIPLGDADGMINPSFVNIFRKSPSLQSVGHGFWNRAIQYGCGRSALSDVIIEGTMTRLCAEAVNNGKQIVVGYDDLNRVKDIATQRRITRMFRDYRWGDEEAPTSFFVCTSHWADALHADLSRTTIFYYPPPTNEVVQKLARHMINTRFAADKVKKDQDEVAQCAVDVADVLEGCSNLGYLKHCIEDADELKHVKEAADTQIKAYYGQVKDAFRAARGSADVQQMINDIMNDVVVYSSVGTLALRNQIPWAKQR